MSASGQLEPNPLRRKQKDWASVSYGAIIILALVIGNSLPSTVVGTLSRNSSSWRDRISALPSYQLSAWVASRTPDCGMLRMWPKKTGPSMTVE